MSLVRRFSLLSAIVLGILVLALGRLITFHLESNMVERAKQITAAFIFNNVRHHFTPEDLIAPKVGEEYERVRAMLYEHVVDFPEIVRIKLYNSDGVIVWSDERELVGRRFPDNPELREALEGKIQAELSELKKTEHVFERSFKRLMELYVPLRLRGTEINGVFEVYQDLDPLYRVIARQKSQVWLSLVGGFALLYVALFAIVKRASDTIELQNRQLIHSEKQAALGVMAGSIGHELNNAVFPLLGYAEMVRMSPDNREIVEKAAEIFLTQSERIALHAKNLLSLSRPSEPEFKEVSVNDVLEHITDVLVTSGILKSYEIVREYADGLPRVRADEGLLEQVIRNLEINAAHAMEHRGVLTLRTQKSSSGRYVEFCVEDTGHGIPERVRHRMFQSFFTTKEKGKGTGLGLSIVKQIVEQHNGYIRVDSEVGVGTRMTVGIPIPKHPETS